MTRPSRRRRATWIAVLLGWFAAIPVFAGEPLTQPTSHYGYYPTQWKTFPGSWSEIRPIAVAVPTTPEPPLAMPRLLPVVESGTKEPARSPILPAQEPAPSKMLDSDAPAGPRLPPSLFRPMRLQRALTQAIEGPALPLPEPLPIRAAANVVANPGATVGKEPETIWSRSGASETIQENKAWLGVPIPVPNTNRVAENRTGSESDRFSEPEASATGLKMHPR